MIGSLLFSYAASSHMDSNIKEWRLFADIANDVGLTLDLVAPVFRSNFAVVSSLATVCKAREDVVHAFLIVVRSDEQERVLP